MAAGWTTLAILDGGGTSRTMRVWDESGTGAGPFSFGQVLTDGGGTAIATFTSGAQNVNIANANTNGSKTSANSAPVVIASDQSAVPTTNTPTTAGGLTIKSVLIASGTNAQNVKASAGQLYKIEITNNSANIGYLKLFNSASAPTAGAGTPVIRLMCPASASGAGAFSSFSDIGAAFSAGIGFTFTGGIADADTTSVAASAFIVNLYYA